MVEMIFGVISGPEEEFDDEFSKDEESSYLLAVTDKETWEKKGHCNDSIDSEVREKIYEAGFGEMSEAIFEPNDSMSKEEIISVAEKLGFEYNEKFQNFMASVFE